MGLPWSLRPEARFLCCPDAPSSHRPNKLVIFNFHPGPWPCLIMDQLPSQIFQSKRASSRCHQALPNGVQNMFFFFPIAEMSCSRSIRKSESIRKLDCGLRSCFVQAPIEVSSEFGQLGPYVGAIAMLRSWSMFVQSPLVPCTSRAEGSP